MWSDDKSIAIGGGDKFGLFIYNDFVNGNTDKCTTFNNEPLSNSKEFKIECLEVWGTTKRMD